MKNRLKIGRLENKVTKPKLLVILGPTASGKSDLAVLLARKFNGEVVSADSRQVYKGLDIGTGKITKKEMRGVPHHLLDVASPKKQFSVAEYVDLTNQTIVKIVKSGKLPIVCGGTGFYIDALIGEKQIPEVPPNPELRKKLENKTTEQLFKMLLKLDPKRASNIDAKNPRRLVRAIEICEVLGTVPKLEVQNQNNEIRNKFEILKIGIKVDDKDLKKRIVTRLRKRLKQGMVAEADKLHKKGLSYKRMLELGLEYRRLADYLQSNSAKAPRDKNKITKSEFINLLEKEIWHYVKRQNTWFKKDKKILWIEPNKKELDEKVSYFLK